MSEPAPPLPPASPEQPGRARGKRLVRWVGLALVALSLIFVVARVAEHLGQFRAHMGTVGIASATLAVVAFTVSQLLLSTAWYLLVRWQGIHTLRARDAHLLCGRAQISKYIPGNVFQYVARHLAFRRLGVQDGSLVLAAAYETLSFVVAAGLLTLTGLPFYARSSSVISPPLAVLLSFLAVLVLLFLVRFGRPLLQLIGRAPPEGVDLRVGQVLSVVPLYVLFLGFSGSLAMLLYSAASGSSPLNVAVIPAYALAWLSGYVVPGASGGLGIREATLLVLLGDNPNALFVALGMRVITTLGDILWFAASSLLAQLQPTRA